MIPNSIRNTACLLLLCILSSCQFSRALYYNFAGIGDYRIFPRRDLQPASEPFHFANGHPSPNFPQTWTAEYRKKMVTVPFDVFLEHTGTVGFLVIKNDSVIYERYFDDYDSASIVASFSMAKSYLSALVGFAVQEGYIRSVSQSVREFVPELGEEFNQVTIRHLLQMTSGIKSHDSMFNPLGQVAIFYYGTDVKKAISKLELERRPGEQFKYSSASTQLLGLVLERSLKTKTVTQYLQEKIWTPLGMENAASWSMDKDSGMEKTFCCLNATTRDYAKFGRFFLREGNWQGRQLLSSDWVKESITPDTTAGNNRMYKYQWWLTSSQGDYAAQGAMGQYIYVHPTKDIIIVRLGKRYGYPDWKGLFSHLANTL
jgi:CubicO group peptidase (beta-lactamase class C family)